MHLFIVVHAVHTYGACTLVKFVMIHFYAYHIYSNEKLHNIKLDQAFYSY